MVVRILIFFATPQVGDFSFKLKILFPVYWYTYLMTGLVFKK